MISDSATYFQRHVTLPNIAEENMDVEDLNEGLHLLLETYLN